MGKQDNKDRSSLYYVTLGVLFSLLAAAAMSQGQAYELATAVSVSES